MKEIKTNEGIVYDYWFLILEVNLIGQIVSGVIFMIARGCLRPQVQLRNISETKCLPETDVLTVNRDEINVFSSFLNPLLFSVLLIYATRF